MDLVPLSLFLAALFIHPLVLSAQPQTPAPDSGGSKITVVGAVYCDTCFNNVFSRHSYFMPGVDVHVQCRFKANSPRTSELISFSANRTTNENGVYRLEIPSVDGIDCTDGPAIQSSCQASLITSSSSACDIPASRATTYEISIKSKQSNLCIYSFSALSFRPMEKNYTLCGRKPEQLPTLNATSFFLPYGFLWPPLPQLPPLPTLPIPPFPPFSYTPALPFPFTRPSSSPSPPSLPFPFPPLPRYPSTPSLLPQPPPPPVFNLGDPKTWIPNIPSFSPPHAPPQPSLNPWDPKTWIPIFPPSSSSSSQNQHP
ncbi:hypothetical protein Ancab_018213 [Ancistrocladus abbreviatus]